MHRQREREQKNERERKDREAKRESNGYKLELFELNTGCGRYS